MLFVIWSSIFAQIFWPTGRLKHQFIFVIIINVLSLGLIYYFVPIYGLYGYLIKFTIVPLLTVLMYFVFWRKRIKFRFKKENITIMLFGLLCSVLLLLLKDSMIYLQILLETTENQFCIEQSRMGCTCRPIHPNALRRTPVTRTLPNVAPPKKK